MRDSGISQPFSRLRNDRVRQGGVRPRAGVFICVALILSGVARNQARGERSDVGPVRNVLLIVADDLKASVLGCYGDPYCRTPNIDRLARSGMVFERAYCQGTSCAPSRLSFMFSRYRGAGSVNLGQHFRQNGWYSARVGKIYHMRVPGDIIAGTNGQDIPSSWTERFNSPGREAHTPGEYACLNLNIFTRELQGRQSTKMPHRMYVSVKCDGDGAEQPDHKSADKAVELLRQHSDRPFFLAVGFVRPHYPMVAPHAYFSKYPHRQLPLPTAVDDDLADIPSAGIAKSQSATNGIGRYPENQQRMWAAYYAAVTFMDEQVGRVLDELDRLGLSQSTAVVFTSDHGYHLGEHGFWEKTNLHEEVTRVPLIIAAPGYSPGRTRSIAELVDLFPTMADLAGLDIPEEVEGASLRPVLANHQAVVKEGAHSFFDGTSLRTPDWAYMRYSDDAEELYDMRADPLQFHNLANGSDHKEQLAQMRKRLEQRLSTVSSLAPQGAAGEADFAK